MPIAHALRFKLLALGRQIIFTIDACSSWVDRLTGLKTAKTFPVPVIGSAVQFPSGTRVVTGWFVPPELPLTASVLLFHGIGDRSHYWRRVQQRLAQAGVSSLIFHYPGYGGNSAPTTPANMESDAQAAYTWLRAHTPPATPVFLLGFSLGSGLAAQVAPTLDPAPAGLILSEAFTTLREAAKRATRPASPLGYLMPDVWKTRETITQLSLPLFLIHSSGDALFPPSMAEALYATAQQNGANAELHVFPGYPHDAVYRAVPDDYWAAILDFIVRTSSRRQR